MRHQQIKRIVDGAKTAILFIHGIIGTPDQFNDLIPFVRKDISIYNILLDGHGKGVRDFASTSMKKWEKQVENAVEELALNHERIIIVGNSKGSGIELTVRGTVKIRGRPSASCTRPNPSFSAETKACNLDFLI